jgi:rhamnogalacturonan endolyase
MQDAGGQLDGGVPPDASSTPDASGPTGDGFYRVEALDRGLIAIPDEGGGNHVSFRMLGPEHGHATRGGAVAYEVLRDGAVIETLRATTHTFDAMGTSSSMYSVRAVIDGSGLAASETTAPWSASYLRVPLDRPPGGTTPGSPTCQTPNEAFSYHANDASVGDLDGDGRYEIVLKWEPSNAKDNSQTGCTGPVLLDAYTLAGERLWRIDLGPNIRAGAHYTQLIVYDLDGDGRAEVACKTAPGTRDGRGAFLSQGPAASDDDAQSFRSIDNEGSRTGYVLTGPEYLTVF